MSNSSLSTFIRWVFAPALAITATATLLAAPVTVTVDKTDANDTNTHVTATQPVTAAGVAAAAKEIAAKADTAARHKADGDDEEVDSSDKDGNPTIIRIESHHNPRTVNWFENITDSILPLFAIAATFGTPVAILGLVFYFRHRRRQQNIVLAREFLAKGVPVPPQLLDDGVRSSDVALMSMPPRTRSQCDMRRGIKLLAIGVGLSLALYFTSSHGHSWAWGLILIVMGLGYLLSAIVEGGRSDRTPPQFPPAGSPPL